MEKIGSNRRKGCKSKKKTRILLPDVCKLAALLVEWKNIVEEHVLQVKRVNTSKQWTYQHFLVIIEILSKFYIFF